MPRLRLVWIPYGQKIPNTCRHSVRATTVQGRALGSCSPGAAAAHAGLGCGVCLLGGFGLKMGQMDFLTVRAI